MTVLLHPTVQSDVDEILQALPADAMESLVGQEVLVTGATGLIGSYLVALLLRANETQNAKNHVIAMTRETARGRARFGPLALRDDLTILEHDVSTPLPPQVHPDLIFHCASETSPAAFRDNPVGTIMTNVHGTQHLLDQLASQGHGRFVFLSTREVYGRALEPQALAGETDFGPVDPVEPRSCYPEAKRAAEALVSAYRTQFDVDGVIVRIAHTYGPGMTLADGRVIGDFLGALAAGENIVMKSDGSAVLSLTYIADCVSGIMLATTSGTDPAYNVAIDDRFYSVLELASTVASTHGRLTVHRAEISDAERGGYLASQPPFLSSRRIRELGWSPAVDLPTGLDRFRASVSDTP